MAARQALRRRDRDGRRVRSRGHRSGRPRLPLRQPRVSGNRGGPGRAGRGAALRPRRQREGDGVTAFGLDVGTSAVKGIAVDPGGTILARASESYPLLTPQPGWAEQDPEVWWSATEKVLARLTGAAGQAQGIGLSGQMHGLVALDEAGGPLRPAILWNDQRTEEECREIETILGFDQLVGLTGNRALTGFTAPKLLWLRRNEPRIFSRIASVLLPKDYVRLRLCGERATDVSDASGTLLFDVGRRTWSEEVCRALDIPSD